MKSILNRNFFKRFFMIIIVLVVIVIGGLVILSTSAINSVTANDIVIATRAAEERGMVGVNGTEIYYEKLGSGTPIFIMHGGLGLDHEYFRPFLDSWADFAQIVYYDHRGNGRSSAVDDWSTVTLDTFVEDAEALRKALGYEKIIVYGHSFGANIAVLYALRYPENLDGLIISDTSPNMSYMPEVPNTINLNAFVAMGKLFTSLAKDNDQLGERWFAATPLLYGSNVGEEVAADIHKRIHYNADAFNRGGELLPTYDVSERMSEISVPTLILAGNHDFLSGSAAHEDFASAISNSELLFLENSAHFPFISEPEEFESAVHAWLDKNHLSSDTFIH